MEIGEVTAGSWHCPHCPGTGLMENNLCLLQMCEQMLKRERQMLLADRSEVACRERSWSQAPPSPTADREKRAEYQWWFCWQKLGKNPSPPSREDKQAQAVGAWEMRGQIRRVCRHVDVSSRKRRLRGREFVLQCHFTCLYSRVDFILKEMRSHAGSPSFSSLPTL